MIQLLRYKIIEIINLEANIESKRFDFINITYLFRVSWLCGAAYKVTVAAKQSESSVELQVCFRDILTVALI